ncbi:MAG: GGDEF domain-containing protein [Treponema sp.]|nr:GGDEF domain-containing protein [Treponema sp.]MCL2237925.1 GGDEF domain-containing protein [Treponema sp.]
MRNTNRAAQGADGQNRNNGCFSIFTRWRYYRLGHDEYRICMRTAFQGNINSLRWVNLLFFVLALIFSVSPIIMEKNLVKTGFYFEAAAIALILFIFTSHLRNKVKQGIQINVGLIYALIFIYYINVIFFGMYLAVWAEPDKIAGSFVGILICVLYLLNISPVLYLGLTFTTVTLYIAAIINFKIPSVWNYDIQNSLFATAMSLIFGWQIIMNRLTMMSSTNKLKDENTIDELTKMKNRRDFTRTFQRFITSHRQSDNFLCIALVDIDYFKNFNDHYGHPQGDECLRVIGRTLNDLQKNEGIYTARVGGEEFALLWHIENEADAEKIGLHVNQVIRDLKIPHEKSMAAPCITVSIGIHLAKCSSSNDIDVLYKLADNALYSAKSNGRNCTVVSK